MKGGRGVDADSLYGCGEEFGMTGLCAGRLCGTFVLWDREESVRGELSCGRRRHSGGLWVVVGSELSAPATATAAAVLFSSSVSGTAPVFLQCSGGSRGGETKDCLSA